jgi:hypothetical protein
MSPVDCPEPTPPEIRRSPRLGGGASGGELVAEEPADANEDPHRDAQWADRDERLRVLLPEHRDVDQALRTISVCRKG